jgi:hypothetical protein
LLGNCVVTHLNNNRGSGVFCYMGLTRSYVMWVCL